jgi:citronellol/citronellal dehydrogenase
MSAYKSIFRPDLFRGQVMVITGGGSGIGRCTAHELAALGAKVVLIGRKEEKLLKTVAEIIEDGGEADHRVLDIRAEDNVKACVASILEAHGAIHGLINNAGGQFPSPVAAINQKGFETVVRTNLVGGFLMAREVYNQHMSKHGGAIVNMLADMWKGMPGMGHSGAARAGMQNFTMTAAVEWAPSGVRVNAVAPGWIASSGMDTYDGAVKAMIPMLKNAVPLKRLGTESEVASAICWLLCEGAAFVTGATIKIDGAASIAPHMWPMPNHDRATPYDGFHRAVGPEVLEESS